MCALKCTVILMLLMVILMQTGCRADYSKRSGISDQRLAELETLISLSSMRGRFGGGPGIAFGIIDPDKLGKRSFSQAIKQQQHRIISRMAVEAGDK